MKRRDPGWQGLLIIRKAEGAMWKLKKCFPVLVVSTILCGVAGHAVAWSWTDDATGEKLDREARHWLTTQNLCGVQLRGSYLSKLDKRIISNFHEDMTDGYRSFLLRSVWRANAGYLDADPEIVDEGELVTPAALKKDCEKRVAEAVKAGMLASPKARPYQWSASDVAFEKPQSWKGWEGDAEGENLDREARQWLTTQNLCGVELRNNYLADLDERILSHFGEKADAYRAYLLASMGHANHDFLFEEGNVGVEDKDPEELRRECQLRVAQAIKAGMLANPKALPFRWTVWGRPAPVYK